MWRFNWPLPNPHVHEHDSKRAQGMTVSRQGAVGSHKGPGLPSNCYHKRFRDQDVSSTLCSSGPKKISAQHLFWGFGPVGLGTLTHFARAVCFGAIEWLRIVI